MKDLWEFMQASQLNEGDTFRLGAFTDPYLAETIDKYHKTVHVNETHRLHSPSTILRRIPDEENPRVLRRALELQNEMSEQPVDYWIKLARKELESESGE